MAQQSMPRKFYAEVFLLAFCILLPFFLLPLLIERYYPEAAPVAAFCVWFTDTTAHAFAAFAFINALRVLYMLFRDARSLCTSALLRSPSPVPEPATLEDGTAMHTDREATVQPPLHAPGYGLTQLPRLFASIFIFVYLWRRDDPAVLERPLLESMGAGLVYFLQGLALLLSGLVGVGLAGAMHWCLDRVSEAGGEAQIPAPAVGVLIDDKVTVDVPDSKREKEYQEPETV